MQLTRSGKITYYHIAKIFFVFLVISLLLISNCGKNNYQHSGLKKLPVNKETQSIATSRLKTISKATDLNIYFFAYPEDLTSDEFLQQAEEEMKTSQFQKEFISIHLIVNHPFIQLIMSSHVKQQTELISQIKNEVTGKAQTAIESNNKIIYNELLLFSMDALEKMSKFYVKNSGLEKLNIRSEIYNLALEKQQEIKQKSNLDIFFFKIDTIAIADLYSYVNDKAASIKNSNNYLAIFFMDDAPYLTFRGSSVVALQTKFIKNIQSEIKKKINRNIALRTSLTIALDAVYSSLEYYAEKSGFTYKYLNFVGSLYKTLYDISLNSYSYYQKFIFKPFVNLSIAILSLFNYSWWSIILFIIFAYHIKDILVGIPKRVLVSINKKMFIKKKSKPKILWIGILTLMGLEKILQYFMVLPTVAFIYLLTSGFPEDPILIQNSLIRLYDTAKVIELIPLNIKIFGSYSILNESGLILGIIYGISNYSYYYLGFELIRVRWLVASCLKNPECVKKIIEQSGGINKAAPYLVYWQYMAYQFPIFQGGKLIVEQGLTLNQYMASRNWRPVAKGFAIAILPLTLGIYFLWDSLMKTVKALKTYYLFQNRLGPFKELIESKN